MLLEGLEVIFIVLTFGANQHRVGLAAIAALLAVVAVVGLGVAVRGPLARAPENPMKFVVGVMLTSFGIFWGAEGAGAHWPGGDAALLGLIPVTLACALALVASVRRGATVRAAVVDDEDRPGMNRLVALGRFAWDFVVGDDWRIALAVVLALAVTAAVASAGASAWWILPLVTAGVLALSVHRAARTRPSPD